MDTTAKIWDTRTGELLYTLRGHKASVWALAFSPDGTRLATGSIDETAKVWDLTTGRELLTLAGHTGLIRFVSFSPNGSQLATSSTDDGTVRVYLLRLADLVALAKTRVTRALTPDECRQYLHVDQCPQP